MEVCIKCYKEAIKEFKEPLVVELHCDYFGDKIVTCDVCGNETSCYIEVRRLKK